MELYSIKDIVKRRMLKPYATSDHNIRECIRYGVLEAVRCPQEKKGRPRFMVTKQAIKDFRRDQEHRIAILIKRRKENLAKIKYIKPL